MKIAILTGRLGEGTGTAGVAARLARGFADAGHDVVVHAGVVDRRPEGLAVLPLGDRATAAERVERGRVRIALDRLPGCEIVRASGGVHRAWLAVGASDAWRAARAALDRTEEALEREAFARARIVVANAARVVGEVVAWHGLPAVRVRLVRTGVDLEAFAPDPARRAAVRAELGVPEGGRVATFVGHGFRRKNLAVAVAAFLRVAGAADRLVVAGRGRFARVDPRVILLGPRPSAPLLAGSDALLLPTLYEAASNATLEALASGVPPCVPVADGAAELVPDRRLVRRSPHDVEGFADALRYAWGDPSLGARCRAAAEPWPVSRMVRELAAVAAECSDG